MYDIFDKIILFLCCTTLYLYVSFNNYFIVPVIIAIVLSSLFIYYDDSKIRLAGSIFFALLCLFIPNYIIFLPLLLYDVLHSKYQYSLLLVPFLFVYNASEYTVLNISFTLVFLIFAYLLKFKSDRLKMLTYEYNELRDSSAKMSQLLMEKNQSILQNQDFEVNVATLNERNRISKEIHDNIGHMLSRALLQVGALLTITKEEITKDGLTDLKISLSEGMNQIRNSIHNMYDESIDLYLQIERLVKDFTFCSITYDYDIKNPPSLPLKHCLIAITKEAFANIIKHSKATKVSILLREHPAMYQLIIQDNGMIEEAAKKFLTKALEMHQYEEGMGLRNIIDRVKGFDGNINITLEQGFKIFISIPKKA